MTSRPLYSNAPLWMHDEGRDIAKRFLSVPEQREQLEREIVRALQHAVTSTAAGAGVHARGPSRRRAIEEVGLYLTRAELESLTSTIQSKRMADWLTRRNWVFEPGVRRGDIPKVARAYHDARMGGHPVPGGPEKEHHADLEWMLNPGGCRNEPRVDFFRDDSTPAARAVTKKRR